MIRTGSARIPWAWILGLSFPIGVFAFVEKCSGTALTFTVRKFVADPALITLLGSINLAFNILVGPWVAWKSDRIRSARGRRKPFIVAGLLLLAPALVLMPLANSLATLVPVILLYQFAVDFGFSGPWNPLYYEIVPPPQRGRAVAVNRLSSVVARLFFNFVLIGRFDEVNPVKLTGGLAGRAASRLTGEQLIYFLAAAFVLAVAVFVIVFVRERPAEADSVPAAEPDAPRGARATLGTFLSAVFGSRRARLLCLLVLAAATTQIGLGQLQPLLITEQFGYTKRALGHMHGIIILLEIGVVLPLIAWLLDRTDRFRIFQVGLGLATLQPLAYWAYATFLAPGGIPPIPAIIAFTAVGAMARTATLLSLEPLVFDLSPSDRLGTFHSGFLMVRGVTALLLMNGVGLWVKGYSAVFCEPLKINYLSGFLYVGVCGLLGCLATAYVAAQRRRGHLAALHSAMPRRGVGCRCLPGAPR